MKIKTSELTGATLDWAVAIAAKMTVEVQPAGKCGRPLYVLAAEQGCTPWIWNPSESWHQGGPIIEKHITKLEDLGDSWGAEGVDAPEHFGPTPLIAAMRCHVASELGGEVEVPEELTCSLMPKNG